MRIKSPPRLVAAPVSDALKDRLDAETVRKPQQKGLRPSRRLPAPSQEVQGNVRAEAGGDGPPCRNLSPHRQALEGRRGEAHDAAPDGAVSRR